MSHLYTCEVTQRSIAFEITNEDYLAIEQRDEDTTDAIYESGKRDWDYNKHTLSGIIDTIDGVSDADYNGHFGPYVFFKLSAEDDSPEKREEIKNLIVNYINGTGEFA
jgi:hypothetical protein